MRIILSFCQRGARVIRVAICIRSRGGEERDIRLGNRVIDEVSDRVSDRVIAGKNK